MKSFERTLDQWREIERGLKPSLDEIDDRRDRFASVETRLAGAVGRLAACDLGFPIDLTSTGVPIHSPPVPNVEFLQMTIRHAIGHSMSRQSEVRRRVAKDFENMELSANWLREMHGSMLGADMPDAGRFRDGDAHFPEIGADGAIIRKFPTVPPRDVPTYIEALHERFHALNDSKAVHPIMPICGYTFDLFRIHPFRDGNGRMVRLALLFLLHKAGYYIGRYISIDGAIEMRRMTYSTAIRKSRVGWSAGRHDLRPWCAFVVELVKRAYSELSGRTEALEAAALSLLGIMQAVGAMPRSFTTDQLAARSPGAASELGKIVLNHMRRQGKLRAVCRGGALEWRKERSPDRPPPLAEADTPGAGG